MAGLIEQEKVSDPILAQIKAGVEAEVPKELKRDYAAEDPVYLKARYTGSDTVFVADAPYSPGKCQELSFIDYSKQQKQ